MGILVIEIYFYILVPEFHMTKILIYMKFGFNIKLNFPNTSLINLFK